MGRYVACLRNFMRHKREVRKACWKVGLFWRGLKHDLSRFTPTEFISYARFHYDRDGSKRNVRDATGRYDPFADPLIAASLAHHVHCNDHHWQHWAHVGDDGTIVLLEMPRRAVLEMFCDWWGAGRAQGSKVYPVEWYAKNRQYVHVHPATRDLIEKELPRFERFMLNAKTSGFSDEGFCYTPFWSRSQ